MEKTEKGNEHLRARKRVLIMTAVEAERQAVLRGLRGDARFEVDLAGVGPALAAARTAAALVSAKGGGDGGFGLVVSAGIGGGFSGAAEIGSLVVASEIVAADLGAETPEGFLPLDELGFGSARTAVDEAAAGRLVEALKSAGLPVRSGPVLTVSTVTGTAATALNRAGRFPGAAAEGMEGYGVAVAASDLGVPALELRAISNPVGPRDRSAWRIKEALEALEAASAILPEVL
ncbi:futalosine hydrolase [Cohnella sp. CFH 77786]|uniref:futalosine hydrolase n=1 Tax=Cohnella sp. CFH 77786 TaxID=2662265 RepID=UPI00351D8A20